MSHTDSADSAEFVAGYSLKAHNTFGFDVRSQWACRIEREAQLLAAVRDPRAAGLPRLVLGGGSNVVLTDDFAGLVLLVALRGRRIVREDADAVYVEAAAGEPWHDFVAWTLAQGLPGLENLALIPGTVGATPIQNIGAYGLEMCERFASLRAVELASGKTVEFDAHACAFGYRDSFSSAKGAIVSSSRRSFSVCRRCGNRARVMQTWRVNSPRTAMPPMASSPTQRRSSTPSSRCGAPNCPIRLNWVTQGASSRIR